jgi:hypothetical protein
MLPGDKRSARDAGDEVTITVDLGASPRRGTLHQTGALP